MDYVNLGSTGLKVSRLCLGGMTYGSKKWREWVLEEEESFPFFQSAWEAGINFYDTADAYSDGVSEEILGRAVKKLGLARERVVLATKVFNPMGEDPNQKGLSRKHIMHAIDASLRRLGVTWAQASARASRTLRRAPQRSHMRCSSTAPPQPRCSSSTGGPAAGAV
jgi:aryl-alcohol dehydrogenase-like predicted oxidoreductase